MTSLDLWNPAIPAYGLGQEVLAYQRDAGVQADEAIVFVSDETLRRTGRPDSCRPAAARS